MTDQKPTEAGDAASYIAELEAALAEAMTGQVDAHAREAELVELLREIVDEGSTWTRRSGVAFM